MNENSGTESVTPEAWDVPNDDIVVLVHSPAYAQWVFSDNHPTQGRRFTLAREELLARAPEAGVHVFELDSDHFPSMDELRYAHSQQYVEQVLLDGCSGEWDGVRRDLATLALRMAGGTMVAAEALLSGHAHTAVHFAGAKHHAQWERSSGFCVFNDLVITARHILNGDRTVFSPILGRRVPVRRIAILDIDAHHGDGTEALLRDDRRVFTFSVHDRSIFPGTGHHDNEALHVFNRPLDAGSGDEALESAIEDFVLFAERFSPDLIFIAMGADGHAEDPLSTLQYSEEGMERAVRLVRRGFRETPILLGGAGGYRPDDITPRVWTRMTLAAARPVDPKDVFWIEAIGDIGYLDDPDERDARSIDEHLLQHAHLFADDAPTDAPQAPRAQTVAWVAPADPHGEEFWAPALMGQIRPGDRVRVLRDAFASEALGRLHNGRICEVLEVRDGDVICRSIDDREPRLDGAHYAPYLLEQRVEDSRGWRGPEAERGSDDD